VRALLVNPWICDFAAYDLWSKPLGLLQIAGYLRRAGAEVILLDCLDRFSPRLVHYMREKYPGRKYPRRTPHGDGPYHAEVIDSPPLYRGIPRFYKRYGMPVELFQQLLLEQEKPDIILVTSGLTYWYRGVFEAVGLLKEQFPSTPLLLGGIYATLCTEHARRHSRADQVYAGSSLPEILRQVNRLAGSGLKEPVPAATPEIWEYGAYDLYPDLPYITLRTSSGCPFRCSYCGWYLLSGEGGYICFEPDQVVQFIEQTRRHRLVKDFAFYDEALLYRAREHLLPILEGVLARNLKCFFHTPNALHARFLTQEIAGYLKKAGFIRPRLALETVEPARQARTGSKVSEGEIRQALFYLQKAGYAAHEIGINVLMGMPEQFLQEVESTLKFVHSLGARIFLEEYAPVPGTPAFAECGLAADTDPLGHNNSIFPFYGPELYAECQRVKDLSHDLNRSLKEIHSG